MPLSKPYPHICRGSAEPYYEARKEDIGINCFAAYEILKADLKKIFEYIEPCKSNYNTYSHRTFELLVRACTEVESLCKLVFSKNNKPLGQKGNIKRYSDLEGAMKLSEYEVLCYGFNHDPFKPFSSFSDPVRDQRSPSWYRAYNDVKHNRSENFHLASLENIIQAVAAVYVLLVAQYGLDLLQVSLQGAHLKAIYNNMFRTKVVKWPEDEKYGYRWEDLKNTENPFDYHPLPVIP
ncbi:hypothetical protein KJ693_00845 [bacterium]|nr:hypothetical protein [bacterium]MBU1613837.1 hypothetical protein [bacterium]